MKTQSIGRAGFTLVEIMIVVAIIGLLAAIAIPNFVRARLTTQANTCISNLRQVDGAKQQWALEFNQSGAITPAPAALAPFLGRGNGVNLNIAGGQVAGEINCPASGKYSINDLQTAPDCSLNAQGHTLPN